MDIITIDLGKGYVTKVDSDISTSLLAIRWRPQVHKCGKVYAVASFLGKQVSLHRLIVITSGAVDHINGDGLDNRRCNLREATQQQNCANTGKRRHNISGYKGVTWNQASRKWMGIVVCKGVRHYLGVFEHKERAAKAVDRAAIALNGEYAGLNFPELRESYRIIKQQGKRVMSKANCQRLAEKLESAQ